MSLTEIQEYFEKRLTYRPGHRFTVKANSADSVEILLEGKVPDADHVPSDDIRNTDARKYPFVEVRFSKIIHLWRLDTEEGCMHTALFMIEGLERHETKEWLRLDGKRIDKPHPDGADNYKRRF